MEHPSNPVEKCQIVGPLLTFIEEREKASVDPVRIFFDGQCSSAEHTTFETLSNHGKIGVFAKDETCGQLMLMLLRCIIDKNDDVWVRIGNDWSDDAMQVNIDASYMESFRLDEPIQWTLVTEDGNVDREIVVDWHRDTTTWTFAMIKRSLTD